MVLSVSAFPEPSPGDSKLITRLFGANRTMDEPQPRQQTRPLPSSAPPPPSPPQPIRATSYKRPRTNSQGFGSGSTTPTTSTPIPISWASRPVDLNAQRPVGAGYRSPRVVPSLPRRHITSISTCASTPISSTSSTPTSAFTSGGPTSSIDTSATSFNSPCLPRARSHSISRFGIRRERSLDGFQTTNTRMRMSPPLPSSPVPLGLSFARLASVSPPQNRTNRVQSQSAVKIGGRDTITTGAVAAATGNNNTRPTFRSLPYKSPTITSASFNPDFEPARSINTTPIIPSPMTPTIAASPTIADVVTRPTPSGPRGIGGKQKLQLSLQIPSIPMLGQHQEQEEQGEQIRNKKPQLPALKLITDTILHPASTTSSSPSIKLSPSPSSPSPISYVSSSRPHSPVSPAATNAKQSSPSQLSPTHSLFSADSRIHLHPLSLSSPISGTTSGSASVRTSIRGWVIGAGGGGGGGGGVSPGGRSVKSLGGRSVNSLGGRRPRSVRSTRSTRSMRSNRSRRSANNKIKIHNIPPVSTPDDSRSTPTPIYSTNTFAYTHLGISGDHVGEFVGDGDGEEKNGFVYGGYGYIEDGWGGGRSPSPIRYARSDSRGILFSDTEDDGGDGVGGFGVYGGGGVYGGKNETGDDSAASSEVEFADVDGDSDSDDGRVRRRRSRRWKGSRDRRRDPPTTNPSSPSLPLNLPQFVLASSHHSSHPSPRSNPSASSPLSSSSSTNSYSNPYSTRKDRKRARKIQLRSFRNSYRMPPVLPLEEEQEGGRGRGEEKMEGGGKSNRTSSPAVMKSMIPFRRKTPPPVTGEEQDSASAKKKKKEGKNKSKDKEKEKGARTTTTTTTKRKPTKSAKDLFNSVSASMSASASQSASVSVLSSNHPQSLSSSSSVPPLPGVRAVHPSHSIPTQTAHSQSGGSGSTFNTRTSSPDETGRKPTNYTARKKFAEAVSSALEEVTSRGRASGGAPFQPASKTKASTAYSSSSQSIPLFDGMEVLDISRLSGEGSAADGKTKAVMAYSGTVSFDEMEVLDISLPGGGGAEGEGEEAEAEQQQQQQMEESEKKQEITPIAMTMTMIKSGEDVRTTSSSLPESDHFSTGYSASDGTKVTASTTITTVTSPVPLPSSSSPPKSNSQLQQQQLLLLQQKQKQQLRGSSLEGATTNRGRNSSGSNRRQYSSPQQPYNRNSPFQLQPAYTTGISCGLPVSRPQPYGNPRRSAVRSRSPPPSLRLLPTPPFSAPLLLSSSSLSSGSVMGLEVAVSSPSHFVTATTTTTTSSRSAVRLFVPTTPPFSVPVITVSESGASVDKGPPGHVEMESTN